MVSFHTIFSTGCSSRIQRVSEKMEAGGRRFCGVGMLSSERQAEVLPFSGERARKTTSQDRKEIRKGLEESFQTEIRILPEIRLYGLESISSSFIADLRNSGQSRLRIYSTLPGVSIPGSHEIKLVGDEALPLLVCEFNEPPAVRSSLTIPELARVAENRLEALQMAASLQGRPLKAADLLLMLRKLALTRDPFRRAHYYRWIGTAPGQPAVITTLEIRAGRDKVEIEHGMHPYSPAAKIFELDRKYFLQGGMGERLIYRITRAFLSGRGRDVHTWFSTDHNIRVRR